MKNSFVSKKGKFAVNLIEKLYSSKILNQLADSNELDIISKCKLSNYYFKICKFLNKKLKRGLPVPFALNDSKECLFVLNYGLAKQFVFTNHTIKLMGLNNCLIIF